MPSPNPSKSAKYKGPASSSKDCVCIGGVCAIDPNFLSKLRLASKPTQNCAESPRLKK